MVYGIRTGDPRGFSKGRNSRFRVGSRVRQTTEEGRRIYRPKCCGNNNKDKGNSTKTLNDKSIFSHNIYRKNFAITFKRGFCKIWWRCKSEICYTFTFLLSFQFYSLTTLSDIIIQNSYHIYIYIYMLVTFRFMWQILWFVYKCSQI